MIFFRFWDRQNSIFLSSVLFFQICRKRDFFSGPFRSFLNLETAKFCCNEWFDWSNISYHPMTSFVTVLTTIVSRNWQKKSEFRLKARKNNVWFIPKGAIIYLATSILISILQPCFCHVHVIRYCVAFYCL
jgi:hypothetical protein